MQVNLYTTLGCHLCDKAKALLQQARGNGHAIDIVEVEIADSPALMDQYGIRIPVVRVANAETELGWPFGYEELATYIGENT